MWPKEPGGPSFGPGGLRLHQPPTPGYKGHVEAEGLQTVHGFLFRHPPRGWTPPKWGAERRGGPAWVLPPPRSAAACAPALFPFIAQNTAPALAGRKKLQSPPHPPHTPPKGIKVSALRQIMLCPPPELQVGGDELSPALGGQPKAPGDSLGWGGSLCQSPHSLPQGGSQPWGGFMRRGGGDGAVSSPHCGLFLKPLLWGTNTAVGGVTDEPPVLCEGQRGSDPEEGGQRFGTQQSMGAGPS